MKKLLKTSFMLVMAMFVSIFAVGAQPASAIVNGNNALQQYGTASIWTPPTDGSPNRHRCNVGVIHQYWGVTTAHCRSVITPGVSKVRASSLNNTSGYEEVGVAALHVHPNYIPGTDTQSGDNDIALVRFQQPIKNTVPLALPGSSLPVGTTGKIAGWGWICDSNPTAGPNCGLPYTQLLQELGVKIVDPSECTYTINPDHVFCGKATGDKLAMACVGDSGAPFVRKGFNQYILNGVALGDGDLVTGHPNFCATNAQGEQGTGRFTDVAVYVPWIRDTMFAH